MGQNPHYPTPYMVKVLLQTCMDIGVLLHVTLLVESFTAVLTGIRSGIGVDQQMRGEGGRALECLTALFTVKASLLSMNRPVLSQRDLHEVTENIRYICDSNVNYK